MKYREKKLFNAWQVTEYGASDVPDWLRRHIDAEGHGLGGFTGVAASPSGFVIGGKLFPVGVWIVQEISVDPAERPFMPLKPTSAKRFAELYEEATRD